MPTADVPPKQKQSSSSSSSRSPIMRTLSAFAAYVALPYILGYILFVRNLESVQELLTPLFGTVLHRSDDATTARRELDASTTINTNDTQIVSSWDVPACYATLGKKLASKPGSSRVASWFTTGEPKNEWESSFERLSVVMHRNGQADPCGSTGGGGGGGGGETPRSPTTTATITLAAAFRSVLSELPECPNLDEKYAVESLLTRLFAKLVPSCSSQETNDPVRSSSLGLLGFCDMGESKTPILLDHTRLVPIVDKDSLFLPCHFHNTNGIRLTALHQFTEWARSAGISSHAAAATAQFNQTKACNAAGADTATGGDTAVDAETCTAGVADEQLRELHLYAVPAGRVFMHSAAYVGQIIDLPHVRGADPTKPVFLQVLSVSPAVFDLYNFFTRDESKELVERALSETKETHRIKRSTTGNVGHAVNNRRTSESGYDTDGKTSMAVKRRCFDVLGFDEYIESHADGLQILRYNLTTAYVPHLDYLDLGEKFEHDYDSANKGGNRFATILLYMTDLDEKDGGETVFSEAWPADVAVEDRVPIQRALTELRESEQGGILEKDSWQENMVAKCRTRLAIRPNSSRAVLFYSQFPNGQVDPDSRHGGCPVLSGTKFAANLWVWSTPRAGYAGNPKNPRYKKDESVVEEVPAGRVTAIFQNNRNDPEMAEAKLYFFNGATDKLWGPLGHGDPSYSIHTYIGHVWKIMVGDATMREWSITSDQPATQDFMI